MRRRRGFTLLEVMIAVAFVGVALVAVIQTQGQGIRLSDEARLTMRSLLLTRMVLAQAQAQSDLETGSEDGDFDEPYDHLHWERRVEPMTGFPGLYNIKVWVHPKDRPEQTGVMLEGFYYREGG